MIVTIDFLSLKPNGVLLRGKMVGPYDYQHKMVSIKYQFHILIQLARSPVMETV